ncbi:MAG TPA: hypothetical protein VFU89_03865 [Rhabdochlamydiaceae bacterium]|nr:hypothetical protein [Rhabdochlamydiaceae bacterium]
MSLISAIFNNYVVPAALSRPMVISAGCILAIPALELVHRIRQDYSLFKERLQVPAIIEPEEQKSTRLEKIESLQDLIKTRAMTALIFGAFASNYIPGSGAIGLLGYLVYSKLDWKNEKKNDNPCISLIVPGFVLKVISEYKSQIGHAMKVGVIHATSATNSFLRALITQVKHAATAVFRVLRSIVKVLTIPFKLLAKCLKIFNAFIRHPTLALVAIAGVLCLIGCVIYGHQLTGSAASVARGINILIGGFLQILKRLSKTIGPIGRALSFIPTLLVKILQVIKTVIYGIIFFSKGTL